MAVTYFNQGFKTFIDLNVMDLFKHYLFLQPAEMQVLTSIINFPWCIKLFYGLIADNVPIFGSKRRAYVSINGIVSCLCLIPLIPEYVMNKYVITGMLCLFAMNVAFTDVIIDALMVQEARKDPKYGSQDLNSYSYIWLAIGGIVGSLMAAYLTEYMNPHISFFICACIGLLIVVFGMGMNKSVDN